MTSTASCQVGGLSAVWYLFQSMRSLSLGRLVSGCAGPRHLPCWETSRGALCVVERGTILLLSPARKCRLRGGQRLSGHTATWVAETDGGRGGELTWRQGDRKPGSDGASLHPKMEMKGGGEYKVRSRFPSLPVAALPDAHAGGGLSRRPGGQTS